MLQSKQKEHKIPKIAFYVYRKNFEQPTESESIDEIIEV